MAQHITPWTGAGPELLRTWSELASACGANASLHPGWVRAVVLGHELARQVEIIRVSDSSGTVGVLPVFESVTRARRVPLRSLELVSNVVSYHAELLSQPDARPATVALFDRAEARDVDLVRVLNVPDGTSTGRELERIARERGLRLVASPGERAPFLPIDTTWDAFVRRKTTKFRSNLARTRTQLAKAGETGMVWFGRIGDPDLLMSEILRIEAASWKAQSSIAIGDRAFERRYYEALLPFLQQQDALFANVVYVRGEPVGYVLCARWHGWVGHLKTSFDARVPNAGARVIDESIQRAFEEHCTEYDFLGSAAPHKLRWTDHLRSHTDYWIYRRTPRAALVRAVDRIVRSAR